MKEKIKSKLPIIISASLYTALLAINPPLTLIYTVLFPSMFALKDKLIYKNRKSELFGISKENVISQKISFNMFKVMGVKHKSEYFKTEMINLFLDMKPHENYQTYSQSLVLASLKHLERKGFITNLTYTKASYKNKLYENLSNVLINLGSGNYKKLLKGSVKYEIDFMRTDKVIDENSISNFVDNNFEVITKNNKISKVKYSSKKYNPVSPINIEHLDHVPKTKTELDLEKINEERKRLESIQSNLVQLDDYKNSSLNEEHYITNSKNR